METVLQNQLAVLAADWDIEVISSTLPPDLRSRVEWRRIRIPRRPAWLKSLAFWALAGMAGAREGVREPRAVTWATGCIVPVRVDASTIHFCHAGYVASIRSLTSNRRGWRAVNSALSRLLALAMERWSLRPGRVRSVLAVSPGLADEVQVHYPGLPVTVTPNGVALPDCEVERERVPGPTRAVFVGGDWARKGLSLAIRAVADHPSALLTVVGTGPESEGPAIASELGVGDRIAFVGYQTDVSPFLDASDVLLLPSAYEACPLVVFEAAARGVVPIVTGVHGVRFVVEHEVSGLILKERTAGAVLNALQQFDSDPAALARMSVEVRRRAADFTWDRSTAAVSEALARLT